MISSFTCSSFKPPVPPPVFIAAISSVTFWLEYTSLRLAAASLIWTLGFFAISAAISAVSLTSSMPPPASWAAAISSFTLSSLTPEVASSFISSRTLASSTLSLATAFISSLIFSSLTPCKAAFAIS